MLMWVVVILLVLLTLHLFVRTWQQITQTKKYPPQDEQKHCTCIHRKCRKIECEIWWRNVCEEEKTFVGLTSPISLANTQKCCAVQYCWRSRKERINRTNGVGKKDWRTHKQETERWSLIMKPGHWEPDLHLPNIYNQEKEWNDKSGMIHFQKTFDFLILTKTQMCSDSVNWHQGLNSNNNIWW